MSSLWSAFRSNTDDSDDDTLVASYNRDEPDDAVDQPGKVTTPSHTTTARTTSPLAVCPTTTRAVEVSHSSDTTAVVSWEQAHSEACVRDGVLAVPISRVLFLTRREDVKRGLRGVPTDASQVMVWSTTSDDNELVDRLAAVWKQQPISNTILHQQQPWMMSRLYKTLATSLAWGDTQEDEHATTGINTFSVAGEQDDALLDHSTNNGRMLKEGDAIVNIDMTLRALSTLEHVLQQQASSNSLVLPLTASPDDEMTDWKTWLEERLLEDCRDPEIAGLLARVPIHQMQVLLRILERQNLVSVRKNLRDQKEFLVVTGWGLDEGDLQAQLALYELERAQHRIHQHIAVSRRKADSYLQQARSAARTAQKNQTQHHSSVVNPMRLRKLHMDQIEKQQNILWNLEKSHLALMSARENKSTVQVLALTTDALKTLRLQQNVVDDVLDEHRDELDLLQEVQDTLTEEPLALDTVDEQDLLDELEHLTMDNDTKTARPLTEMIVDDCNGPTTETRAADTVALEQDVAPIPEDTTASAKNVVGVSFPVG